MEKGKNSTAIPGSKADINLMEEFGYQRHGGPDLNVQVKQGQLFSSGIARMENLRRIGPIIAANRHSRVVPAISTYRFIATGTPFLSSHHNEVVYAKWSEQKKGPSRNLATCRFQEDPTSQIMGLNRLLFPAMNERPSSNGGRQGYQGYGTSSQIV